MGLHDFVVGRDGTGNDRRTLKLGQEVGREHKSGIRSGNAVGNG